MFSKFKKISYLPLLLLTPFSLLAEEVQQGEKADQMLPGYNAPARLDLQSDRPQVYFTGSFTYWQASQDNMELGFVSDSSDPDYAMKGSFVNMDFDYKPGFQVGAGVSFLPDNWDLYAEYTWFRGTNHKKKDLQVGNFLETLFPTWQAASFTAPQYYEGSESWTLHMDLADLRLGRDFFVGKCLTFHPFIGLRAPFIRQQVAVTYSELTTAPSVDTYLDQMSHSWGVGPSLGTSLDWLLGKGFKLYGKGDVDVVYTEYTTLSFKQKSVESGEIIDYTGLSYLQKNLNTVRSHIDLALGFEWGTYIAKKGAHISLAADYGFQVFFNQNMFRTFIDSLTLAKSTSSNGNLYIQGLTATLRADF